MNFTLTENQKNTLDIIKGAMIQNIENGKLTLDELENNFKEVFFTIYNEYQEFLKNAHKDTEFKNRVLEEVWKELQGV